MMGSESQRSNHHARMGRAGDAAVMIIRTCSMRNLVSTTMEQATWPPVGRHNVERLRLHNKLDIRAYQKPPPIVLTCSSLVEAGAGERRMGGLAEFVGADVLKLRQQPLRSWT